MKKPASALLFSLLIWLLFFTQGQGQALKLNGSDTTIYPHKSPTGALFRSLAIPGWGQAYNHRYVKSAIVLLGEGTIIGLFAYEWQQAEKYKDRFQNETDPFLKDFNFRSFELHRDNRNTWTWILAGTVFISMWDAYVDAQLYNFKQKGKELDLMGGLDKEGRMVVGVGWRF